MLNLIRKFLRPTLREQLEDGVREALRRYADRRLAPELRVYVSTDLLPDEVEQALWASDETDHLRRFARQWAEDHNIARTGLRLEVILLDTKREFAFVKPVQREAESHPERGAPLVDSSVVTGTPSGQATLEVVDSPALKDALHVHGELTLGRRSEPGVLGIGDRYMSARHARLKIENGRLWITDLDSKNRTFVNDEPLSPHQPRALAEGDTLRLGITVLRVARIET